MTMQVEREADQRASQRSLISALPYLPALDGMRAVAVVAVMIYHANSAWLSGGFLGVEVFFVISGYLITLLLIAEHERNGYVNLKQFWVRRFRRLLPALCVMLVALSVYMALFNRRPMGRVRGDILGGLGYISNWYQIWVGQGYTAQNQFVPLRHLWSLAVEEQFYLVWPLVMVVILARGRHRLPRAALWLGGTAVAITLAMAVLFHSGPVQAECADSSAGYWTMFGRCISINDALYLGTFSRAGGLLLGAAFAMVWRPKAIMRGPLRDRPHRLDLVGFLGLACLVVLMIVLHLSTDYLGEGGGSVFDARLFRGGFLIVGLVTLMMIGAVTHPRSWFGKLMALRPLVWVGTRSYGLYLYHWPIFQIIRKEAGVKLTVTQTVVGLGIAAVITEASYRLVEMPIRRGALGEWMRGERRPRSATAAKRRQRVVLAGALTTGLAGFAGVSLAFADNVCVGAVECQTSNTVQQVLPADTATDPSGPPASGDTPDSAGSTDSTIAGQTTVPGDSVAPTQPTVPGETTVPTVAPTEPPPTLPMPIAFGESVMLGAQPQLWAEGQGAYVNAVESRGTPGMLEAIAAETAAGRVGPTVIVQLGTNGSVSDESFDAVIAALPATSTIYVMTVFAPKGNIAATNSRIFNLTARHPNVRVIDWAGLAQTIALCPDNVHVSCGTGAARAYANLVFESIGKPELVQ